MARFTIFGVVQASALCVLAALLSCAYAIEDKCAACTAVANHLQGTLDSEGFKNSLDMRGRIDSHANRMGKIIKYEVSELRMVELFEDLCSAFPKYEYFVANDTHPAEYRNGTKKTAKRKMEGQQMMSYCSTLIEKVEDDLAEAIRAKEHENRHMSEILCYTLTKPCKEAKKPTKKSSSGPKKEANVEF